MDGGGGGVTLTEGVKPCPTTCTGTRLLLREIARTSDPTTAAPPSAMVPSRRYHPLFGGWPPALAALEGVSAAAAAVAALSSAMVRGPATAPATVSVAGDSDAAAAAGSITMAAASAAAGSRGAAGGSVPEEAAPCSSGARVDVG